MARGRSPVRRSASSRTVRPSTATSRCSWPGAALSPCPSARPVTTPISPTCGGGLPATELPRVPRGQLPHRAGAAPRGRSHAHRRDGALLRREMGDVRLVPRRPLRLRRVVRRRRGFRRVARGVNYWEPWYLGLDPAVTRKPGLVTAANGRTGAYRRIREEGRDLHELHALMAPRPFLVSGGSEDGPARWGRCCTPSRSTGCSAVKTGSP